MKLFVLYLKRVVMNKTWTFIGGVVTGIIGVFTAAAIAVELEQQVGSSDVAEEEKLALPEGGSAGDNK